jgi:hypothetical protein
MKNIYTYLLQSRHLRVSILVYFFYSFSQVQAQKAAREAINPDSLMTVSKVMVYANAGKGYTMAEAMNLPDFFGKSSQNYIYKNQKITMQRPPRTIDTIMDITNVILAEILGLVCDPQPLPSSIKYKPIYKNQIYGLPNVRREESLKLEPYLKTAEVDCKWVFNKVGDRYIPTISLKVDIYGKNSTHIKTFSTEMKPEEVKTDHMKSEHGMQFDFVKGFSKSDLEEGVPGNIVVDVYTQALLKLFPAKTVEQ